VFGPDKKPEPSENSRFFGHGYVILEAKDFKTRQASLEICLPHTLLQAITPSLLGSGWVDRLKVKEPISVWIPQLTAERMNNAAAGIDVPHIRSNMALKQWTDEVVQVFQKISQYLIDPSDIIPFLPMGTYVQLRFRCRIDDIPKVLEGVQNTPVIGIPDFQWALASVLAMVCMEFQIAEERTRLRNIK
jgi:hypothetical protein